MQWIVALRACKWVLAATWSTSLVMMGVWLWVHIAAIIGLSVVALGEYIWMCLVLDDIVHPVNTDATALMKSTSMMVCGMALGYVIWQWKAMLWA